MDEKLLLKLLLSRKSMDMDEEKQFLYRGKGYNYELRGIE
jgi:hypothetical protein